MIQIYSLIVPEVRNLTGPHWAKIKVSAGLCDFQGETISWSFSASRNCLYSLACGPLHLESQQGPLESFSCHLSSSDSSASLFPI